MEMVLCGMTRLRSRASWIGTVLSRLTSIYSYEVNVRITINVLIRVFDVR
jgi:hypothetical protein